MNWDSLQMLLAILRRGAVPAAAAELGASEATVRRRLARLQAEAGEPLFEAQGGRLRPTAFALRLRDMAEALELDLQAAMAAARASGSGRSPASPVTITATEMIGAELLAPLVAAMAGPFPHLAVKLGMTERNEDLLRGEADIAVRLRQPSYKWLVTREAPAGEFGLFAARRYLEATGAAPSGVGDLKAVRLIGSPHTLETITLLREMGVPVEPADFSVRINSQLGQFMALRGGLGGGVAMVSAAAREPGLVRVLPQVGLRRSVWVCMHEDLRDVPGVRLVFRCIVRFLHEVARRGPEADPRLAALDATFADPAR